MARSAGTVAVVVDAQDLVSSLELTVTVRGARRALWRVKVAATLVVLASRVLGGRVDLQAELG